MAFSSYEKVFSTNPYMNKDLQQLQGRIEKSLIKLLNKKHLDSEYLSSCSLISGVENLVEHKMSKAVKWQLVSQSGPAMIYENTFTSENTTKYLSLITTVDVTVNLLVWTD